MFFASKEIVMDPMAQKSKKKNLFFFKEQQKVEYIFSLIIYYVMSSTVRIYIYLFKTEKRHFLKIKTFFWLERVKSIYVRAFIGIHSLIQIWRGSFYWEIFKSASDVFLLFSAENTIFRIVTALLRMHHLSVAYLICNLIKKRHDVLVWMAWFFSWVNFCLMKYDKTTTWKVWSTFASLTVHENNHL